MSRGNWPTTGQTDAAAWLMVIGVPIVIAAEIWRWL